MSELNKVRQSTPAAGATFPTAWPLRFGSAFGGAPLHPNMGAPHRGYLVFCGLAFGPLVRAIPHLEMQGSHGAAHTSPP